MIEMGPSVISRVSVVTDLKAADVGNQQEWILGPKKPPGRLLWHQQVASACPLNLGGLRR